MKYLAILLLALIALSSACDVMDVEQLIEARFEKLVEGECDDFGSLFASDAEYIGDQVFPGSVAEQVCIGAQQLGLSESEAKQIVIQEVTGHPRYRFVASYTNAYHSSVLDRTGQNIEQMVVGEDMMRQCEIVLLTASSS